MALATETCINKLCLLSYIYIHILFICRIYCSKHTFYFIEPHTNILPYMQCYMSLTARAHMVKQYFILYIENLSWHTLFYIFEYILTRQTSYRNKSKAGSHDWWWLLFAPKNFAWFYTALQSIDLFPSRLCIYDIACIGMPPIFKNWYQSGNTAVK